jgi:hypothetical protein
LQATNNSPAITTPVTGNTKRANNDFIRCYFF